MSRGHGCAARRWSKEIWPRAAKRGAQQGQGRPEHSMLDAASTILGALGTQVLDTLSEGILVIDAEGRLVTTNSAAMRLHGWRRADDAACYLARHREALAGR